MRGWGVLAVAVVVVVSAGCGHDDRMMNPSAGGKDRGMMGSGPGTVAFAAVAPTSGATGVAVDTAVALRFNGPMADGMEQFVDLHVGDLSGPTVPMSCGWSGDRQLLTCRPDAPLAAHTTYVIHVGGRMTSDDGSLVDYTPCLALGGRWITGGMMGGTHAGRAWGMMGGGWQNPNGAYGMAFTFTTA